MNPDIAQARGNLEVEPEWLDDDIELYQVSNIFIQIPYEYSGMGGVVGKQYQPIKDFLKWNDLDVKYWTPIVLQMGKIWASELQKDK